MDSFDKRFLRRVIQDVFIKDTEILPDVANIATTCATEISLLRLFWLGHVLRMPTHRLKIPHLNSMVTIVGGDLLGY